MIKIKLDEALDNDERGLYGEPVDTTGWVNKPVPLKSLKKGEYFTLKDIPEPKESQVWVKDDYDRIDKEWICYKFSDVNQSKGFKGTKMVYTDFIF